MNFARLTVFVLFASLAAFAAKPAPKIQMAILLDTSSSMDGLISQAQSRLWHIVNEAALTRKQGQTPDLEVALYEYGKSSIPQSEGYIRQLVPLTTDLDQISEALFALRTDGGDEYCGQVIDKALDHLAWSPSKEDYKAIFIAGNEGFNQGPVPYETACRTAIEKGVVVNTIYCGPRQKGIAELWQQGATAGQGAFSVIDQNQQLAEISAPQDDRILELNKAYNQTFISYDAKSAEKQERALVQDQMVVSSSKESAVQRTFFKAAKKKQKQDQDLVAAVAEDEAAIAEADEAFLPAELKDLNTEERIGKLKELAETREKIESELKGLREDREAYLNEKRKSQGDALDSQMKTVLQGQLKTKNFKKD